MQITNQDYAALTKKHSKNTKLAVTLPRAFFIGGGICVIGEAFSNLYLHLGAPKDVAGTLTSITLIFLAALLTGLQVYDKIARIGGAGTLIPITGFANAVVASAIDFKTEGYVLGVGAKMFILAGPVIVYGTTASFLYGVIYFIGQHM